MDKIRSNKISICVFVLPTFLLLLVMNIAPLFISLIYSFFNYDGIMFHSFEGFNNYIKLFMNDKSFAMANYNILIRIVCNLFIQLPIAFLLALILSKGVRGEELFRNIYFIPAVISSIVIGQLWINIFKSDNGLLNVFIRFFVPDFEFSWLTNPKSAVMTTIVPSLWQFIGYHMLIFYTGLKGIPKDYYEAAAIDGASSFKTTIYIAIPILAPVIKVCTLFCIVGSVKTFDYVYIMTGGGPNNISHSPATLMFNSIFKRSLFGYGSAQAIILVLQCIIISIVIQKIFKKFEENI